MYLNVDGDGFGDLLIGADRENNLTVLGGAGRVYLYSGATGVLIRALVSPNEESGFAFGSSVAGVPDADGDGRGDLLIGARGDRPGASPIGAGRAYLFSGATGSLLHELASPNEQRQGYFGSSVDGVPDADGDGRGDLLVGAPNEDAGGAPFDAGRAYLFSGATGALLFELRSGDEEQDARFGSSVAGVPDANGDGRGDLLVGAPNEDASIFADVGLAYLFSGAPQPPDLSLTLGSPSEEAEGDFGFALGAVPDTDGDGLADLLVGAPFEAPAGGPVDAGQVHLFSASGFTLLELTSPNSELLGRFGRSVAGVPDADGDGFGDLLVGAPFEGDNTALAFDAGRAYLFSGATGALLRTLTSPNAQDDGRFGWSVAGVPDADGDGRGDLLVGAYREEAGGGPTNAGRAYLFSGATGALLRTLSSPNPEGSGFFGYAVAGTGDTNGDGRGDLFVGAQSESAGASDAGRAYLFSGAAGAFLHTLASPNPESAGRFGFDVDGVPDATGDGRADLLVGAPREDPGTTPADAGRAYLFDGQTGMLVQTLVSPTEEEDGRFGRSVAGVPDATGDGRGEVFVGAPFEDADARYSDAGRAHLFNGQTGAFIGGFTSPNEEEGGQFGWGVAGLPDLDGDGRGDLAVGATKEDPGGSPFNAGRAYIFSGTAGMLPPPIGLTVTNSTSLTVAPGGSVVFFYTVQNNTDGAISGDLYYTARLGGGTVAQGLVVSGTLPAGQATTERYIQEIPATAPAGTYDYCLSVGTFPTGTTDEECFTLVVTGSTAAARVLGAPAAWPVTAVTPWASEASAPAFAANVEPGAVQAYPNPFRSRATLRFALEEAGPVRLAVYDALGREVAVLVDGAVEAGQHAAAFDGSGLAAGVYLWRLEAGGQVQTGRLTLLR